MQNFDATAASLGQNWFQDSRSLMMDASANAASQMMPGASAPGVMAGAPIMLPPGVSFGPGPITGEMPPGAPDAPKAGKHKMLQFKGSGPSMPMIPFGGAFANGGIAPGGKVSLVGERGPEWIVPSGPTAVVPMGQIPTRAAPLRDTGSAMDRHMSTGLSGQPTRPVGRSMKDAGRQIEIAGRRLRSAGDYEGAARLSMAQDWHNQRLGSMLPQIPQATPERPMGSMPGPGGKWVDGRSAGSQVWQPNAPVIDVPSEPIPMPSFGTGSSAPPQPLAPLPLPALEGNNPLTGLPLGLPSTPMPSGFNAMNEGLAMGSFPGIPQPPPGLYGPEAPPPAGVSRLPGTDHGMVMKNGEPTGAVVPIPKPQSQPSQAQLDAFMKAADAAGFAALNVPGEGWQLKPKAKPQDEGVLAFNAAGETKSFPADYELPPGWQPMKRKAAPAGVAAPQGGGTPPVAKPDGNAFAGKTTSGGFKIK